MIAGNDYSLSVNVWDIYSSLQVVECFGSGSCKACYLKAFVC